MLRINVPLTSAKTAFTTYNMQTCQRTVFQIRALVAISNKPDFAQFCGLPDPDHNCMFCVTWYDTANVLHCTAIGKRRVLRDTVSH